jgi:hypothetical protein
LKHFIEDSYEKRMQFSKGADSEDFISYWTNWETDASQPDFTRPGKFIEFKPE